MSIAIKEKKSVEAATASTESEPRVEKPIPETGSVRLPPEVVCIIWNLELKSPTRVSVKCGGGSWTVKKRSDHYYIECFFGYTEGTDAQTRVRAYMSDLAEIKRLKETVQISYDNLLSADPSAAAEWKRKLDEYEAKEGEIRALMAPYEETLAEFTAIQAEFAATGEVQFRPESKFGIHAHKVPRPSVDIDVWCVIEWDSAIKFKPREA